MKILYTHKAIDDLERLYDFIAKDSKKAAAEAADKIQQAIRRLLSFPLLGKEISNKYVSVSLRDLITSNYVIRYAAFEKEIHVLRIWHGKEDR